MARKIDQTSLDPKTDIRTDLVLVAAGTGVAFLALIYLILS